MTCDAVAAGAIAVCLVVGVVLGVAWIGLEWRYRALNRRGEAILAEMDQFWVDLANGRGLEDPPDRRRGETGGA